MEGITKARKIGTSLGVLIPAFAAEGLNIKAGTPLIMRITDKEIIIRLKHPKHKSLLDYVNNVIAQGITEDLEV